MIVQLIKDGNVIIALIGPDLQSEIAGGGFTVPEALRNLADQIEREKWTAPELKAGCRPVPINRPVAVKRRVPSAGSVN
jgi:hypothetical protein